MSPESQRIAIAEACGFKITRIEHDGDGKIYRVWAVTPDSWTGKDIRPWLPDINDLNVCHEFERILSTNPNYMQKHAYNNYAAMLCEMCKHEYNAIAATAAQRAEAFLKTIGKWTNDN